MSIAYRPLPFDPVTRAVTVVLLQSIVHSKPVQRIMKAASFCFRLIRGG